MRSLPFIILLSLLPLHAVAGATSSLTYIGVLVADGFTNVILADSKSGQLSGFIRVGETFAGYRVVGCRSNLEAITVAKDGREYVLELIPDAKIKAATPEIVIGKSKFDISADAASVKGTTIVFLGNVRGKAENGSFSSDEATLDRESGKMTLTGNARMQIGESRSTAERMILITKKAE